MSPYHQRLFYNGTLLEDDITLQRYEVKKESTMCLAINEWDGFLYDMNPKPSIESFREYWPQEDLADYTFEKESTLLTAEQRQTCIRFLDKV
jgi:hypothetical protein